MAKLAEIKNKENDSDVKAFIQKVKDEGMRTDSFTLLEIMHKISKEEPKMWGASMIGFGNKIYKSPKTGREVEWLKIGFSPRKTNLSLHLIIDMATHADLLNQLGKHKTGVGCLYIKKLNEVDLNILEKLIQISFQEK